MTVALVTGGSRGIGRAISVQLASHGMSVAINYASNKDSAAEVVDEIESSGGTARMYGADVSDESAVAGLFEAVTDELGAIGVLVNNAGIVRDGLLMRMSSDDWDRVVDVNLKSVFLCTRAALRPMLKARWGRVISVTSVAGLSGNAGQANYAASKAGIVGFTKSIAKEVGSRGITVNAVAPGFITTDMTADLGEATMEQAKAQISVGRLGTPQEVAGAVGYLASEQAAYINGQVLVVDGGLAL